MRTLVAELPRKLVAHAKFALRDLVKNGILASPLIPDRLRHLLLRPFGASLSLAPAWERPSPLSRG